MHNISKPLFAIFLSLFLICFSTVEAQTDVDLDPEYGGRISASIDKKIVKGLHVSFEEEVRLSDNFSSLGRLQTTMCIDYKINKYIKIGLGYAMINPYSSKNSTFKSSRHRLMADATGSMRYGNWRITLKERFQLTHRTGDINTYQNPINLMSLKSRLQVKYKGLERWEPYAYIELRNTLNAPVISAYYNAEDDTYMTDEGSTMGDAGWFLDGYNGVYVNRVRGSLGVDYIMDKRQQVRLYMLLDHVSDKVVDANKAGTTLKSYTRERGFVGQVGLSYEFSF